MERLVEEPVDYDPFAAEAPADQQTEPTAAPAVTPPSGEVLPEKVPEKPEPAVVPATPPEAKETVVVPEAPELPEVIDLNQRKKELQTQKTFKEEPVDYDPFADPASKPNWLSNIVRGVGERGGQLIGGTAGIIGRIGEAGGDWLDQNLGKPVREADGTITWRRLTPEETKGTSSWITQKLLEVEAGLKNPDLGYDPHATWQDVKNAPFTNIVPFAVEQGLVSLADMIAAVRNPAIYTAEQTEEIGTARAGNEGRAEPTVSDLIKALPAAAVSTLMEKIGTEKMFGVGEAALSEFKQLPAELVKTLLTEGATEAAQQAAQDFGESAFTQKGIDWWKLAEDTLSAGLVGAIFGPAVRTATGTAQIVTSPKVESNQGEERTPKRDDVPNTAQPTQQEGTPAEPDDAAAAETATPGGPGAATPAPPAGTEKQPVKPGTSTVVPPTDPRSLVKPPVPQSTTTRMPGVVVTQPGQVSGDVAAAMGVDEEEEFDPRKSVLEGEADMAQSEHEARVAAMFAGEADDLVDREHSANKVTVAPAGTEISAALNAGQTAPKSAQPAAPPLITTPIIPRPAQGETLGTGRALQPQPSPAISEAAGAAAAQPTLSPAEPLAAAGYPSPVAAAAPVEAAPVSPLYAPGSLAPEDAPMVDREAAQDTPMLDRWQERAEKAEALKQEAAARKAAKDAEKATRATAKEQALKDRAAAKAAAQQAATQPKIPEAQPIAEPAPRPTPAAVTAEEPSKAVALKAKAATKAEPAPAPAAQAKPVPSVVVKRRKPVVLTGEALRARQAQEAPAPGGETKPAPAAAPAAGKAVKTPLSRSLADEARTAIREAHGEELTPGQHQRIDDLAAEVARDNPRKPEQSPREHIASLKDKVTSRIRDELAADEEAALAEREAIAERNEKRATPEGREQLKREEQAKAEKGQQKERTGKTGKSGTGILAESEDATRDAVKREQAKPEAERDPNLLEWDRLRRERAGKKGEERDRIQAQMNDAQARRAKLADQQTLKARASSVEKQLREAIPSAPELPDSNAAEKLQKDHLKKFLEAIKGIPLAGKISLKHNSPLENLAIYAQKQVRKAKSDPDIDPADDVWVMQRLLAAGEHEVFNNEIRSEDGFGTGGAEEGPVGEVADRGREEGSPLTSDDIAYSDEGEVQPLRRGRAATREANQAIQEHEARRYKDFRPVTVTRPNGSQVAVTAETRPASSVLREVNRKAEVEGGFVPVLRSMLVKHLTALVGDVDVHHVSQRDMIRLAGANVRGAYFNYSDAQRAQGMRPMVFISTEEEMDPLRYQHTVLHELTHAATSQVIRDDLRGVNGIITGLRQALNKQLSDEQYNAVHYAFTNNAEFVAEAFSNPHFQEVLAALPVPPEIRAKIGAIASGRRPTWWDTFVDAVSYAIGMIRGQRGHTFMEQMVALTPTLTRSSFGQERAARERMAKGKALPGSIFDVQAHMADLDTQERGVLARARDTLTDLSTTQDVRWHDKLNTTAGMMREAKNLWGDGTDAFRRLGELTMSHDELRREKTKRPGGNVDAVGMERDRLRYAREHPAAATVLDELLDQATTYQVDPTAPRGHRNNAHISKAGARSNQARAQHALLSEQWQKLPQHAQDMGRRVIDHYRRASELEANAVVKQALTHALHKNDAQLPPGVTIEQAVDWVRSKAAARNPEERDAFDKQMHDALGKIVESIAEVPELSRIKGVYVPKSRRGRYFISGALKVFDPNNLPKGAILDAKVSDPLAKQNRLLFKNEADLNAFTNKHDGPVHVMTRYVDRQGKKIHHKEPAARKIWVATVQNKYMEMGDSFAELNRRAGELRSQGHEVAQVRNKNHLRDVAQEISSPQIKRLLRGIEQTTVGQKTVGQDALKNVLLDAHIRTLTRPGHLQRRLKRRNVKGNAVDGYLGMREYHRSLGANLANMEISDQLAEADRAVQSFLDREAYNNADKNPKLALARQSQLAELRSRLLPSGTSSDTRGARVFNAVRNWTVAKSLVSPHFTLMQVLQNATQALPALAGIADASGNPAGYLRARREMQRAMKIGGGMTRTLGRSVAETVKGIAGREQMDQEKFWYDAMRREKDGAELIEAADLMNRMGVGANNSVETGELDRSDMTRPERVINKVIDAGMTAPTTVERINRYSTLVAAYRIYREMGQSPEEARLNAVLKVDEGQTSYGSGNYARAFKNPYLGAMFQFRKYGLAYGNLFYRSLVHSLPFLNHPDRRAARKTLAGLVATTAVFAGLYGQAFIEPLRALTNALFLFGASDDTWEDKELKFQNWLKGMLGWVSGSKGLGDSLSEAMTHGLTRLLNVDTSNSMSNDSLVMYKQPQHLDSEGTMAWLMKTMIGASGSMIWNTLQDVHNGDYLDATKDIMPKVVNSIWGTIDELANGITSKKTGESYGEINVLDAITKTLGFKPAVEARQWEAGGGGTKSKALKDVSFKRRKLMQQWRNEDRWGKGAFFRSEIRDWNRAHPDQAIGYDDLLKSERSQKAYRKRVEEMAD